MRQVETILKDNGSSLAIIDNNSSQTKVIAKGSFICFVSEIEDISLGNGEKFTQQALTIIGLDNQIIMDATTLQYLYLYIDDGAVPMDVDALANFVKSVNSGAAPVVNTLRINAAVNDVVPTLADGDRVVRLRYLGLGGAPVTTYWHDSSGVLITGTLDSIESNSALASNDPMLGDRYEYYNTDAENASASISASVRGLIKLSQPVGGFFNKLSTNGTNLTTVGAQGITIKAITAINTNASHRYLRVYQQPSTSVDVATTVPVLILRIPPASAGMLDFRLDSGFALGDCSIALTTSPLVSDATGVTANEITVNILYS